MGKAQTPRTVGQTDERDRDSSEPKRSSNGLEVGVAQMKHKMINTSIARNRRTILLGKMGGSNEGTDEPG